MAEELSPARARELIPAEALAHVPGYMEPARVIPLAGGAVNRAFRIDTAAGRFVLRLHDALGIALGANHLREAQLQSAAAASGVAPRVVYVDPSQRYLISEYAAGRIWTPDDFSDVGRLRALGETLRTLHAVTPPIAAPFDLATLLRDFAGSIAQRVPAERPLIAQLMARAETSLIQCASAQRMPALFHSDPQHSNIIETRDGLLLIDWEYAAVGDPLFDLACVLAYYPQATPHARALLEASGLAPIATLAMLEHATWLYVLLGFFWDRARRLGATLGAGVSRSSPAD